MTKRLIFCAAATSMLALAACSTEPETIVGGGPQDDMAEELAAAPPVELPPAVKRSESYRCKDNSVVYIDWLSDNKSANVRLTKDGAPTVVKAAAEGEPMVAEGYSLAGNTSNITLTAPGKGSQSCKA